MYSLFLPLADFGVRLGFFLGCIDRSTRRLFPVLSRGAVAPPSVQLRR